MIDKYFKNLNLLYVDENKDSQNELVGLLEKYFQSIVIESNPYIAYETFLESKIDVIITEVDSSVLDGISFIQKIRLKNYWVPIIVLTANLNLNILLPCVNSNIQGYITKPLDDEKILSILENLIKYKNQTYVDKVKLDEDVFYDSINYLIEKEDEKILLNKKERLLLDLLLENKNKVVSYKNIETIIWYYDDKVMTQDALKNVIKSLRKKISKDIIKNISGLGYKLII